MKVLVALAVPTIALTRCGTTPSNSQATADAVAQNAYMTATAVHLIAQQDTPTRTGSTIPYSAISRNNGAHSGQGWGASGYCITNFSSTTYSESDSTISRSRWPARFPGEDS
jgi:hypothetical protein